MERERMEGFAPQYFLKVGAYAYVYSIITHVTNDVYCQLSKLRPILIINAV